VWARPLQHFLCGDLGAFYLDIPKDRMVYQCGKFPHDRRGAAQTVLLKELRKWWQV